MRCSSGWLVFGLVVAGPASAALSAAGRTPAPGAWGDDTLILEIASDGADVEFECARGRISKPITLDRRGDFDLPGTFAAEGHGPIREDAGSAGKARYGGHVAGDTLTLTVVVGDERMGPYTLTRGRRPILKKCG